MARVRAPVIAAPDVPPVTLKTPVFVIVTAPVPWSREIPFPATFEVTPVFVIVKLPPKAIGEPLTDKPVDPVNEIDEF